MEKKFDFRYQTISGLQIKPAILAAEKEAFEQKHNKQAAACFAQYETAYVLAVLSNDGKILLRGLIIANAA